MCTILFLLPQVTGSLLDVEGMGLGMFHFIHSTGVLHDSLHRPGLRALRGVLHPSGGMHLWVYVEEK